MTATDTISSPDGSKEVSFVFVRILDLCTNNNKVPYLIILYTEYSYYDPGMNIIQKF